MLKGSHEGLGANKSLCRGVRAGVGKVEPLAIKSFMAEGGGERTQKRKARARKQFSTTKLFCRSLVKQLYKKTNRF